MNDGTITREAQLAAAENAPRPPPILALHGVDRHYRQGNTTLQILRGAKVAIWPGGVRAAAIAAAPSAATERASGEVLTQRENGLAAVSMSVVSGAS